MRDALRKLTARLNALSIPYAVVGAEAPLHGQRGIAEGLDVLVTRKGLKLVHAKLVGTGYHRPFPKSINLRDADLGVNIAFAVSGEFPGDGKPKPVAFPDPVSASYEANEVRYLNLNSLIELKLASGMSSAGRLKDLSDVLELIETLDIPLDYASNLNPYVQAKFQELWQASRRRFVCPWRARPLTAGARSLEEMIERLEAEIARLRAMKQDGVLLDAESVTGDDYARLITRNLNAARKYGMEDESEFWGDNRDESDGSAETSDEPVPGLCMTRYFDDTPEHVFDAWLGPDTGNKWPFTRQGRRKSGMLIDARTGTWCISDMRDGKEHTAIGKYLEVDRPRRLMMTFSTFSLKLGRVVVNFAAKGAGCLLNLTHECLPCDYNLKTESAWSEMLDGLEATLLLTKGHGVVMEPGTVRLERLLPGPIQRVWAYLSWPDLREKWLASGAIEPEVGSSFDLRFHHASLSPRGTPTPEQFKTYEQGYVTRHQLIRFEPLQSLSFTWGGVRAPSEVRFELTSHGDKVLLGLTHERLGNRAATKSVACGWRAHLAILVARLNDREPPSFWSIFAADDGEYEKCFVGEWDIPRIETASAGEGQQLPPLGNINPVPALRVRARRHDMRGRLLPAT